jgi:hypothetical protein
MAKRQSRSKAEKQVVEAPEWSVSAGWELIAVAKPSAALRVRREGVAAAAVETTALEKALKSHKASMTPLFGTSEERLINEASAMAAIVPAAPIPDLSIFYRLQAPENQQEALVEDLLELEVIEAAYFKPPAELPYLNDMEPAAEPAPPVTADYTPRQIYLNAAPEGIDARHAWTVSGGNGQGVRIIDIEGAWRFSHEDLLQNQGGVIGGTQSSDLGWRNHGTAVVGEFGGDRNSFGITGISPDANVRAISIFGGVGSANAIRQAANALSPGDIILIELHRAGPRFNFQPRDDQRGYIAIEWWPDDFAAVQFATSRGVIVVEAAGNGAENLDDALYSSRPTGFPTSWTNPFNRSNRDSGAIVVGAGAPPPGTHGRDHGPDRSRLDFSNFGALIDAQGWGREVTTAGYGDLQGGSNEDEWYTDRFSGTSSASPIVVGAIACVQGALRARGRTPWTPARTRQELRATGSPQQDAPGRPRTQRIGNRPNLRELMARAIGKTKEIKEFKELKEKEFKEGKDTKEIKERFKDIKDLKERRKEVKDGKEFKEPKELKDIFEGRGPEQPQTPSAISELEQRVAQLEGAFDLLIHFISGEHRPDLSTSSLAHEPDLGGFSSGSLHAEAVKQQSDAKPSKDYKDLEKPVRRMRGASRQGDFRSVLLHLMADTHVAGCLLRRG